MIGDSDEGKERLLYGTPLPGPWTSGRARLGQVGQVRKELEPFTFFPSLLKAEAILIHNKL